MQSAPGQNLIRRCQCCLKAAWKLVIPISVVGLTILTINECTPRALSIGLPAALAYPPPPRGSEGAANGTAEEREWWQEALCQSGADGVEAQMIRLPMLARDIEPDRRDYNIYLAETGCNPRPLFRVWCSVESASCAPSPALRSYAQQNPGAKVWFLVTSPTLDDSDRLVARLRAHYGNLRVVGVDLDRLFAGTPVEQIFTSGNWTRETRWPANNLSNLLRNVLLWQWGGFNSDTDCLCVRSIENLRNVIAYDEKQRVVNNAVMHFDARHDYVGAMMEYHRLNFKTNVWHTNGPGTATATAMRLCETRNLNELLHRKCPALTLLPLKKLQFYRFDAWKRYFEPRAESDFLKKHREVYVLHLYNKLSEKEPVRVGSSSIYDSTARRVCPVTYAAAGSRSDFF
ncbi:lactosylceramide 4-alpha-galactosyltransferase-like [Penaeus monodon]|uniref:lactosylceramide 4-alpha-galactosyltransferase-like n=1 Tax=Penaeus monodon TaxID=6687 RepID=UPI0018A751F1|nr:lactosylceramide 4-alpha-galactosyltransferase-like [Penaeus monodon]